MEESWDLEDEAKLLDAIADCGFGNWTAIGCRVNRKPNGKQAVALQLFTFSSLF